MAHYAKIVNGIVVKVLVADEAFFESFVDDSPGIWLQTSYNTRGNVHYDPVTGAPDDKPPLRKNYAGIGYIYDPEIDGFIEPQPFPSWSLDKERGLWFAPKPMPEDGGYWQWNEELQEWQPLV